MLSLAKQFSRLATVFVSLEDDQPNAPTNDSVGVHIKQMNNFYLPQASSETVESYIQVNNMRFPQFSTVGTKHHFMRLQQCLGTLNSVSHASCISSPGYGDGSANSRQFLFSFDLETTPGAQASGLPVQGGGTVQVSMKNVAGATKAYCMTHYDAVLEIKSQGAIAYS